MKPEHGTPEQASPAQGRASLPLTGIVVVDKPLGWTSHQVVGRLRRVLGTRKIGHAGTLDPMATGVLVAGVGRATRLLGYLMLTEKEYVATIRLGISTHTDDADGQTVATPGASGITEDDVREAVLAFLGEISQVPSSVSAIKVDGKRSYARVRAGEEVELAPRQVTVHAYVVSDFESGEIDGVPVLDLRARVRCSSGTYIRALARDLGAALGSAGHLTALRRTWVGNFGIDRADVLDTATLKNAVETVRLVSIDDVAADNFATVTLSAEQATDVGFGRRLRECELPASPAAMMGPDGRFLALYTQQGADAVAEAVFVGSEERA